MRDSRKTIARNVAALLVHRWGEQGAREKNLAGRLIRRGVTNGNATRILEGDTSVGVKLLDDVARILSVPTWVLLREDFDPAASTDAWPFPRVDRARWDACSAEDRGAVQQAINAALTDCERLRDTLQATRLLDEPPPGPMPERPQGTASAAAARPSRTRAGHAT